MNKTDILSNQNNDNLFKERPKDIEEYIKWFSSNIQEYDSCKSERYYQSVMNSVEKQFISSKFWNELITKWDSFNQEYYTKTGFNLFAEKLEKVYIKPYQSMLDKTYRKNVVLNQEWPNKPLSNWIYPQEPFENLNDLLRTTIIVKYLDGAEFILEKLRELSKINNYDFRSDYEAKDKGYYAIHAYIKPEFEVEDINWDSRKLKISIEIQITTQIQDTIKKLTHEYYNKHRSKASNNELAWQWDYKSDDFALNYMGHILHYLEGMIMEIRGRKGDKNEEL